MYSDSTGLQSWVHKQKDFRLDTQRAFLLLRTGMKFGSFLVLGWILRRPPSTRDLGVRLRLALEELGLTYLKVGQFLAMRYDLLPDEISGELNKLFENVSPLPLDQVTPMIEAELGAPVAEFFSFVNPDPIGSASVAQVHEARILNGARVAVKIQRPGVERTFASDIRNYRRIASLIDALGVLRSLSAVGMVDEFAAWTSRELNFVIEGRTADRLRAEALPQAIVPRILWDLTTPKLLTMEFVDGISLSYVSDLLEKGGIELVHAVLPHFDLEQALHNLAVSSLTQIFLFGFFHGDPHPGNLLVCDDNRLAFVDFGIFGIVTVYQREVIVGFVRNIALGNIAGSFRYFSRQFAPTDETDLRAFQREAHSGLRRWYESSIDPSSPMRDRHLGKYIGEMLTIARRNHLRMAPGYLLFWRVLNALDATVLRLSPQFDIIAEMRGFFEQTEPNGISQVLDLTMDVNRAALVTQLVQGFPHYVGSTLHDVRTEVAKWSVVDQESPGRCQARNRDTAWLTIGLVGLSISALFVGALVYGSVPTALIAAVLVLSSVVILLINPRH